MRPVCTWYNVMISTTTTAGCENQTPERSVSHLQPPFSVFQLAVHCRGRGAARQLTVQTHEPSACVAHRRLAHRGEGSSRCTSAHPEAVSPNRRTSPLRRAPHCRVVPPPSLQPPRVEKRAALPSDGRCRLQGLCLVSGRFLTWRHRPHRFAMRTYLGWFPSIYRP